MSKYMIKFGSQTSASYSIQFPRESKTLTVQHVVYYKSILATFKHTMPHKEIKTIHQDNEQQ